MTERLRSAGVAMDWRPTAWFLTSFHARSLGLRSGEYGGR